MGGLQRQTDGQGSSWGQGKCQSRGRHSPEVQTSAHWSVTVTPGVMAQVKRKQPKTLLPGHAPLQRKSKQSQLIPGWQVGHKAK